MIRSINTIVRIGARSLVFLVSGVAFLCAVAVVLTQFDPVRRWGVREGLKLLNNELQGRVEIGAISGNIITGLTLHEVSVITDSTTMVYAPLIDLRYQLRPFFRDNVIGASVVIHNPVINLVRNAHDSIWNFAKLVKESPVTDSVSSPFPYTIDVHALEIQNATVSMSDLTQPMIFDTVARSVNYSYIRLESFNLSAQARIEPVDMSVWIQNLAFYMPHPDIRMVELAGRFAIDTNGITVDGLRIETERTLLDLDARIDSANFFANEVSGTEEWGEYPVQLALDAKRISTLELRRFLPDLAFLDGNPAIELEARGTYGDIAITTLQVDLTHSAIAIKGRLLNLDNPDSLFIEARMGESKLNYADAPLYVPGLEIPDLAYLGDVRLKSAAFVGYADLFNGSVDASTDIGTARGGAWMDLRGNIMRYNANVSLINANLEPVIQDQEFASDFNGNILANGSGTSLDDLNTEVRVYSESSTIGERSYQRLIVDGSVRDNGFIMIDTLLAAWGPKGQANEAAILNMAPGSVDVFMQGNVAATLSRPVSGSLIGDGVFSTNPALTLGGWLDMRNTDLPRYNIAAQGRRVALSDVMPGSSPTRMSFTIEGSGVSFDPDLMQGTATINVTHAELPGNRPFTPISADVALVIDSVANRTLRLRSNLADIDMAGQWDFSTVINGIAEGVNGIVEYLSKKASYREEDPFAMAQLPFGAPVSATYNLAIKNLAPLEIFLPGTQIHAVGELQGEISGTSQLFSITANGTLQNLLYRQDSMELRLLATQIGIELRNIAPGRIEDISTAQVVIRTDSTATFNGIDLNAPRIRASLEEGEFHIRAATAVNNQVSLAVNGQVNTTDPEGYRIQLDTVRVGLPNGIRWRNVGLVEALVNEDEVRIDTLAMRRANAEIISVRGSLLGGERLQNIQIKASEGYIRGLSQFIDGDSRNALDQMGGWLRELEVNLEGTLKDPTITATLAVDSLSYSGNFIGNILTNINYADKNLTGNVSIGNLLFPPGTVDSRLLTDTSHLTARIDINTLPVDLSLSSVDERLIEGRNVDIKARTDSLPIAFIAPFTPGVQIRGGLASLDFSISGQLPKLNYTGRGALHRARALIEGNNILYYADARIRFEKDTLWLDEMLIRNDPRDLQGGRATVQGSIDLAGFELGEIDLTAQTNQLLVLSDATQAVNETIYGDLVIASGVRPVKFTGKIDRPKLSGDISVLNGNLRMERGGAESVSSEVVNYVDYADWMRQLEEETYGPPDPNSEGAASRPPDTVAAADPATLGTPESLEERFAQAQERLRRVPASSTGERSSLTDALQLDLNISIAERLFLTIDFSPIEQLRAELTNDGDTLRVQRNNDGEMNLSGTVAVQPGSKYIFIKTFDATGSLSFSGPVDNTKLSIKAEHTARALRADNSFREYQVLIFITGTLDLLEIRLDYMVDGQPPAVADQESKNRNAISLLLFGRPADEIAGNALRTSVGNLGSSLLESGTSSVASRILTDILAGGTEFIRSLDIDMSGSPGNISQAKLNVVSQFGRVIIRAGGQISNPTANGTVTIDLPLSVLLDLKALRNIVIQLEREAQSFDSNSSDIPVQGNEVIYRARIQWRYVW